ncbi:MAG: methyltransferase [Pseudomonadota bacterium]
MGGRVMLRQPRVGYRAATDAVFLAAACPAQAGESVLDLGLGVGAAALCLLARVPGAEVTGLEVQAAYAELARKNAQAAGASLDVVTGDAAALPEHLRERSFDHVITNPPFFEGDAGLPSEDPGRNTAFRESMNLADWLDVAQRRLRPRGTLTLVHRTERLGDILSALAPRCGAVRITPLQSRSGRPSKRVIVRAIKGSRAPLMLDAPFTLHAAARHEGDFEDMSEAALAILRDGHVLN